MKDFMTNEWISDYLCCIVGEDDISYETEHVFSGLNFDTFEEEKGVMKIFGNEDYTFHIYFIGDSVQMRENGVRVRIKSLAQLDKIVNKQIEEHFQI